MTDRLSEIPGFSIDRVAGAAGDDPDVLRLENLDTDLVPPADAVAATRDAVGTDDANSYLPFVGQEDLRAVVADRINRDAGTAYTARHVVITCGATEGLLDALLALTNPGDEVVLTDPTYAGMIYRARLAGCTTRLVPFVADGASWTLDLDALRDAVTSSTRVLFLMNPSMPSGAVLSREAWAAVAALCNAHDVWLLYNASMERIVFDGRPVVHPAAIDGLRERTITVGSVSKEYRMIGWRVGWVVGPASVLDDVGRTHIYNCVTPGGFAQRGALAALRSDPAFDDALATWQHRRDVVTQQLDAFDAIPAAGGWSQLLDVASLGFDSFEASERLLEHGRVAATPMRDWGDVNGDRFVRLVFSNEPVDRLRTLRDRVETALGVEG